MSLRILLAAALILVPRTYCAAVQTDASSRTEHPDTGSHDRLGPISVNSVQREARDATYGAMREFLWEHYLAHRRGEVVVTTHSIEGDPCTAWYWVEPDAAGTWRIHYELEGERLRAGPHDEPHWSAQGDAYVLQRVQAPSPGSRAEPIPISDRIPGRSYTLTFIGKDGKVLLGGF